jgi:hypothetical protein
MADIAAYKQRLIDVGMSFIDIAESTAAAAGATAGLPIPLPSGVPKPRPNLSDAAALSSTAQNIVNAAYSCADALAKLETAFPTPPPEPPPDPSPTP